MLGVRGHAQVIDARAEDAELEGPFEAELVRLRVADEIEEGPEREAQDRGIAVPPRGRDGRFDDVGCRLVAHERHGAAACGECKDPRLLVGDERQRLAQESFGVGSEQAEPP